MAQHIGVELEIETVHQAKGLELVLGKFAGEPARDLAAELLGALAHQLGNRTRRSGTSLARLLAQIRPYRRTGRTNRLACLHRDRAPATIRTSKR